MAELPSEAERLLAVAPDDFVDERKKLARSLRDDGRRDEAKAVETIKKPSPVVLAVNRAARDRPRAAENAATAADRVVRAQLSGKADEYRELVKDVDDASALLSEVALANLSKSGRPTEAMRRRVASHIRGALAKDETRGLLARGSLTEEIEPRGFDAYAGLPIPESRSRTGASTQAQVARERRAREKKLRAEISAVRTQLAQAERRLRSATRERDELVRRLEGLEADLGGDEA